MRKKILLTLAACSMASSVAHPAFALELNFDPQDSCTSVLKQQKETAGIWTFGYLAGRTGSTLSIDDDQLDAMISDIAQECLQSPDASYFATVEQFFGFATTRAVEPAATADSADPQSLLDKFADGDQPLGEILLSLRPRPEDVRAVFPEPMASNLLEMYEELFGERLAGEDFPTPFVIKSSTFTTTMGLATHPILDEISGGFKNVLGEFQVDVPWGTIAIDFPSADDGMKLHGMTFVNGRWVLMMRPWRGME